MAASPEQVHDLAVRHRIGLGRYSTTVVRRIVAQLNRTHDSVLERLARTDNETIAGQRMQALIAQLDAIMADGWKLIAARLNDDLSALAVAEEAFSASLAGVKPAGALADPFSPLPSETQIVAAVKSRPFAGRLLADWLSDAESGAAAKVRDAIRQGFIEGRPTADIVRTLRGTKANGFKDGLLEINRRSAEALVRTSITHTSNTAAQATYEALGVTQWKFCATLDSRTTILCASLHGRTFPINKGPMPPRHVNCLIADSHVATAHRVTSAFKRWYDGDVVVIHTAGGKQLTCTPNHPILTDGGWVAAGLLNVGGNVVCDAGIKRVGLVDLDDQNVEARIEDVAEALLGDQKMAAIPVPTTAEDFHGDGMNGQIAIVATDRRLNDRVESALHEHASQGRLGLRYAKLALVSGLCAFRYLLIGADAPANRCVGLLHKALAFLGRRVRHPHRLLFASVAGFVPALNENPVHDARAPTQFLGDAGRAHAGYEQSLGFVGIEGQRTAAARRNAQPAQTAEYGLSLDAQLARDLLNGLAGPVTTDVIVGVERAKISAHVFNLETVGGWYVAENIITHNCRSTTIPVVDPIPGVKEFEFPSYEVWLRKQDVATQDDILGVTKARLFRDGGLSVTRFVDNKGKTLTLAELRRRDVEAFRKAGL